MFFGDTTGPKQFCAFLLIMTWVNLRISIETGRRRWREHRAIHGVVFLTLCVFYVVTMFPVWSVLPRGIGRFLILSSAAFVVINSVVDKLLDMLYRRYLLKVGSPSLLHVSLCVSVCALSTYVCVCVCVCVCGWVWN
jgi:hypothetical protein